MIPEDLRQERIRLIRDIYKQGNVCCLPTALDIIADVRILLDEVDKLRSSMSVLAKKTDRWKCSVCDSWNNLGKNCYCGVQSPFVPFL